MSQKRVSIPITVFKKIRGQYGDYYVGKIGISDAVLTPTRKNPNDLLLKMLESDQQENRGYNNEQPRQRPPLTPREESRHTMQPQSDEVPWPKDEF